MSILFKFILAVHVLIALGLVGMVLLQRSEGGVLGVGGSTSGLMTARGAADLLTRGTRWLGTIFICTSIALAIVAARDRKGDSSIVTEMDGKPAPTTTAPALSSVPTPSLDMSLPGAAPTTQNSTPQSAPAQNSVPTPTPLPAPSADPLKMDEVIAVPEAKPADKKSK
jgi:preprotein translocase subunit SecG